MILNGEYGSLQAALNTVEIFGNYSGLIINTDKTQVVWIGKKRGTKDKLNVDKKLSWGSTSFNLLGVKFITDLMLIPNLNYRPIIEDLPKMLHMWKKRYTTTLGKITILKTFILPKLIHLFTVLPKPPPSDIKQINTLFYHFIWNNKPEKIKRVVINKPYQLGGLKMIDLDKFVDALQLTWVKRFLTNKGAQWANLAEYNIGNKKKFMEMGPLWHQRLKDNTSNPFYYSLLSNWEQFFRTISKNDPMSMPLWYNPFISKSVLYNKSMYYNGCIYIADICKGRGEILSCDELNELYHHNLNFLDYHRLKLGLNNYVKKFNATDLIIKPIQPSILAKLYKRIKGAKLFYKILLDQNGNNDFYDYNKKWSNILSTNLEWNKIFSTCFYTIKDNDLIWFQY